MPLVQQRASATLLDANAVRFLTEAPVPARVAARPGRGRAERTAGGAAARRRSTRRCRRRCTPSTSAWRPLAARGHGRSIRRSKAPRIPPSRRMQDDLKKLHGKIIQAAKRKDETLRRQFQHAPAQAFPGGHPAGARSRLRLLPEQVRSGARRPAERRIAGRHGHALGDDDLGRWPVYRYQATRKSGAAASRSGRRLVPPSSRAAGSASLLVVCCLARAGRRRWHSPTTTSPSHGMIDERLHGERERTLPRVYARPVELRRGQALSPGGSRRAVERSRLRAAARRRASRRVRPRPQRHRHRTARRQLRRQGDSRRLCRRARGPHRAAALPRRQRRTHPGARGGRRRQGGGRPARRAAADRA